jgi:hypothetical protein
MTETDRIVTFMGKSGKISADVFFDIFTQNYVVNYKGDDIISSKSFINEEEAEKSAQQFVFGE